MRNYLKDVSIDESALDVELLRQSELTLKYGEMCAAAKHEVDVLKDMLELMQAELSNDIRKNPTKYGIEKVTDSSVTATLTVQKKYQSAVEAYNTAKYNYEIAKGAVAAIDTKKEALRLLVTLFGQQYFAGPSVPRDLSFESARQKRDENVQSKIGKTLSRTKQ